MLKYAARHYDDQLRLNVSLLLWIVLLYSIRHMLFFAAGKFMPLDDDFPSWVVLQSNFVLIPSDLPALLVLLAIGHRTPDALGLMRRIWLHGRVFVASSYFISMALFIYLHWDVIGNYNNPDFISALCVVIPDIAIITYLFRSERVKDIFSEFE